MLIVVKVRRFACVLLIALCVVLPFWNCRADEAQPPTKFSVGFIAGLSGQYALLSQRMLAGAELAAEDCNERLSSHKAQLVVIGEDDHLADNKTTLTVVKKLTRVDRVVAIVTWAFSAAETIKTGLSGDKTPILFFWDSNDAIPPLGSNFYGTGPSMGMQADTLVKEFLDSRVSTIGSLVLVDNWFERMNLLLQREIPAKGLKLVASESILPESTDLRTPLLRLKQREPEALVVLSYGPSFIAAVRQAKQMWPRVRIYGFG
jgi:branched-chain amino acid transport system substrate-binding protein